MATTRTSRAASLARDEIIDQLKDDHRRVRKAYREFQKLDADRHADSAAGIVQRVLAELSVHAALEEELLYPAARAAVAPQSLIDEAEIEHESMHALIDQLSSLGPGDDKYAARFTVLCEYVLHHVKEEEGELFPRLQRTRLDWEGLAADLSARREELMAREGIAPEGEAGGPPQQGPTLAEREERGAPAVQRR
jgi:hemerythrin superfamily protein